MEKSHKKVLSMPVYSVSEGLHLGYIKNIVVDPKEKQVLAFIVERRRMAKEEKIIPFAHLQSIGEDVITIDKAAHLEGKPNLPQILKQMNRPLQIVGARVFTVGGKILGKVSDFRFDSQSGALTSLDIGGGSIFKEKSQLDAVYIITISGGAVMVADAALDNLEGTERPLKNSFDKVKNGITQTVPKVLPKKREEPTFIDDPYEAAPLKEQPLISDEPLKEDAASRSADLPCPDKQAADCREQAPTCPADEKPEQ